MAACSSGKALANSVFKSYKESFPLRGDSEELFFLPGIDFRFSDSETCVRLNSDVSGCDVFLFQGLFDPESGGSVDRNLMALFAAIRAFREWGSRHVTVIVPYFAYARQDKPSRSMREPTTARLVSDLLIESGIDRIIAAHPHVPLNALFGRIPVHSIETIDLFVGEFNALKGRDDVIAIAPDGGALKFVSRFGRALSIKTAVALKERSPDGSVSSELVGEMKGKTIAVVLDDMISSGETISEVVRKLAEISISQIMVGATHNLCMDSARYRLMDLHSKYSLKRVVVTDSIAQSGSFLSLPFLKVKTLANIIATIINRVHYEFPADNLPDAVEITE
jgi:ribose-phosphate pyrophosphokinase